jgi:hypothetical protein
MLRGVGEPLPRRRTPGLVHHGGGGASRAAGAYIGKARGAAPTKITALMMAAATSIGVTARAAVVAAPTGAVTTAPAGAAAAAVAVTTALVGAAAAAAAPAEFAGAAAASAAKVFLLRLTGGRPRLRGTSGVAAGSFTLFLLPNGRPRLRPLDLPGPPAPAPPKAPIDDMAKASWKGRGAAWQGGRRHKEVGENPRELRDFKGGRGVKSRAGLMLIDGQVRRVALRWDISLT